MRRQRNAAGRSRLLKSKVQSVVRDETSEETNPKRSLESNISLEGVKKMRVRNPREIEHESLVAEKVAGKNNIGENSSNEDAGQENGALSNLQGEKSGEKGTQLAPSDVNLSNPERLGNEKDSFQGKTLKRRTRKELNKIITALARTGHVPLFSSLDEGVYRVFEDAVVDLFLAKKLTILQLQEIAAFLPFIGKEKRLSSETCSEAGLPVSCSFVSRNDWLQSDTYHVKILKDSIEVARQGRLTPVRDMIFHAAKELFGERKSDQLRALILYGLKSMFLNVEISRLFVVDLGTDEEASAFSGISAEQSEHGMRIIDLIHRGMKVFLKPATDERTPASFVVFGPLEIGDPKILLGGTKDSDAICGRIKDRVSINAECFVNLVLYYISEKAEGAYKEIQTNSASSQGLNEISESQQASVASVKSAVGKKTCMLPSPFDAALCVASISDSFKYVSPEISGNASSLTAHMVGHALAQRKVSEYLVAIDNRSQQLKNVQVEGNNVYVSEKRTQHLKATAKLFTVLPSQSNYE